MAIIGMASLFLLAPLAPVWSAQDPRIDILMKQALNFYSERRYIKALDLFKQVLRIDPDHNLAKEYVKSTETRINEWETTGGGNSNPARSSVTWDNLMEEGGGGTQDITNARDIIAARKSLVDRMKHRSVNTENIVRIENNKRGLEVMLFHDQLFLPGLLTLRDESLPILEKVAMLIKEKGNSGVRLYSLARHDSQDPFLLYPDFPVPAPDPTRRRADDDKQSFIFQDIEASRSFILFTYLAQRSMVPAE